MEVSIQLNVRQKVSITEVSPEGHIYVQIDTPQANCLIDLSDRIQHVIDSKPKAANGFHPSPGTQCFAQSQTDNIWYRAIVVQYADASNSYSVYYVDYGNKEDFLPIKRLFPPVTDFFTMPYQATKCSLAYFIPNNGGVWNKECVNSLRDNVLNQTIPCVFHEKVTTDKSNSFYLITLYWDDSDEDYTVAEELVAMGLGTYNPVVTVSCPDLHILTDSYRNINLTVGKTYQVYVTVAETPDMVWCQLAENTEIFENLVINLQDAFQQPLTVISDPSKNPPPLNEPCYVIYDLDNSWCRGLIQAVDVPSNTADVLFVDFGNTEVIPISNVFIIPNGFLTIPAQAISLSLHGLACVDDAWSVEALDRFKELSADFELKCEVVCLDDNGYPSVRLINDALNQDIAQTLIKEGFGIQAKQDSVPVRNTIEEQATISKLSSEERSMSYTPLAIPIGSKMEASVTNIDNLHSFHCQLYSQADRLTILMEQIAIHCESSDVQPVKRVMPGMPVLAQFVQDNEWYRAYMTPPTESDVNKWGVVFVDYGNKQGANIGELKQIPTFLLDIPIQSFHCCLVDCPFDIINNKNVLEVFRSLALDEFIECLVTKKVVGDDERDLFLVKIFKDGNNILNELIQIECPAVNDVVRSLSSLSFPVDQRVVVTVCYVESVTNFACQLANNTAVIENLQIDLNKYYQNTKEVKQIVKPVIGTCCVALFSEDNQWYRAIIQEVVSTSTIKVLFVDYGNTETVSISNTQQLVSKYFELPSQSVLCTLDGIPPTRANDVTDTFCEMCTGETFEAEMFLSTTEVHNIMPCKLYTLDTGRLVSKNLLNEITPKISETPPPKILETPPPTIQSPLDIGSVKTSQSNASSRSSSRSRQPPPDAIITEPSLKPNTHLCPSGTSSRSRSGSRSRQSSDTPLIQSMSLMIPTQIDVLVSHVVSPSEFYIQHLTHLANLTTLLEDMFKYYGTQKKGFPLQSAYVGVHCSAPFIDGNYYRGRICSLDYENARVYFLDYGNTDIVPLKAIFTLSSRFTSLPAQAIKCRLSGVSMATGATANSDWSHECIKNMQHVIITVDVLVNVTELTSEDCYEVNVTEHSQDLAKFMIGALLVAEGKKSLSQISHSNNSTVSHSTRSSTSYSTPPPGGKPNIPPLSVPMNKSLKVVVTEVSTRCLIYCQISSNEEQIDKLRTTIDRFIGTNPKPLSLNEVEKGKCILGQFSGDNIWYRGKIISVDNGVKVGYVDYGNVEIVPITRVCDLPGILYDTPAQAIRCQLNGLESCLLGKGAKTVIEEKLLYAECQLTILKKESGQKYLVDLVTIDDGCDVKEWISECGLITDHSGAAAISNSSSKKICVSDVAQMNPQDTQLQSLLSSIPHQQTCFSGFLVHIESIDKFYCQPIETADMFDSLSAEIQTYYDNQVRSKNAPPLVLYPGLNVAALYSADNLWYRAEIININDSNVNVVFVDYGNTETTPITNIRYLVPQFAKLSINCVQCKFIDIKPLNIVNGWLPTDTEAFASLVGEEIIELKLSGITDSYLNVVEIITENGVNVGVEMVKKGLAQQQQSTKSPSHKSSSQKSPSHKSPSHKSSSHKSPSHKSPSHKSSSHKSSRSPSVTSRSSTKKRWNSGSSSGSSSSCTSVSLLPPFNISEGDVLSVYVSHQDDHVTWVQPAAQIPELSALAETISEIYVPSSINQMLLSNLKPGSLCCAQFTDDDEWYRARIISNEPKGLVHVLFVDYGNTDILPPERLCHITKELLLLPQLGIPCVFDSHVQVPNIDSEKSVCVQFFKRMNKDGDGGSHWKVELVSDSTNPSLSPYPRPCSPYIAIPDMNLNDNNQFQVYIVHSESPDSFYCQIVDQNNVLEETMALIADYYTDNYPPVQIVQDTYCVAQYSENDTWYRAKIVDVLDENQIKVIFVDYGNQEVLPADKVAGLDPQFSSLPCQAFQCSLFLSKPETFTDKHLECFYSLNFDESFQVTLKKTLSKGVWFVELKDSSGSNINDIFTCSKEEEIEDPYEVTPTFITLNFEPQTELDVYITVVNGPDSFYCQPLLSATQLEELMTDIATYMSAGGKKIQPLAIESLNIGQCCLAVYGDEGEWFRGVIEDIDINNNVVEIHYVDYGNKSFVEPDHITSLPRQFVTIPSQVIHCTAINKPQLQFNTVIINSFCQLIKEDNQYTIKIDSFSQTLQQYTIQLYSNHFNEAELSGLNTQLLNLLNVTLNIVPELPTVSSPNDSSSQEIQLTASIDLPEPKTPSTDLEDEEESEGESEGEPLIHAPCKLSLASGEELNVYVVHIQDPSLLYIHRADCLTEMDALSQEINQYCSDFADTLVQETYHPGDFVLAFYDTDSLWYRGYVEEVLANQVLNIHFIDYGNTEHIAYNKVIMCPGNFLELPIQAIPCSLTQIPNRDIWPKEYMTLLNEIVTDVELKLSVIVVGGQGMYATVSLTSLDGAIDVSKKVFDYLQEECDTGVEEVLAEMEDGKISDAEERNEPVKEMNNNDTVIPVTDTDGIVDSQTTNDNNDNLLEKKCLVVEESRSPNTRVLVKGNKYDVYLITINTPYDFVCQLYSDTSMLESIASILEQVYTENETQYDFGDGEVSSVGDFVCAKYSKDDLCYRAKVIKCLPEREDEYLVEFIDYGNEELVRLTDLKKLAPELITYSPLALYCGLSGLPEAPNHSEHFTSTLVKEVLDCIGEEGLLSMEITNISDNGRYSVVLSTLTVNINDVIYEAMTKLLSETEPIKNENESVMVLGEQSMNASMSLSNVDGGIDVSSVNGGIDVSKEEEECETGVEEVLAEIEDEKKSDNEERNEPVSERDIEPLNERDDEPLNEADDEEVKMAAVTDNESIPDEINDTVIPVSNTESIIDSQNTTEHKESVVQNETQDDQSTPSDETPPVSDPVSHPPVSDPVSHTPVSDPVSHPPVSDPVSHTPVSDPVSHTPVSDPVSHTPVSDPVSHTPVSDPVSHTPVSDPVSHTPVSDPVSHTPVSDPVSHTPVSDPVSHTPVSDPVSHTPVSDPVSHTPVSDPVSHTPVSEPVSYPPPIALSLNDTVNVLPVLCDDLTEISCQIVDNEKLSLITVAITEENGVSLITEVVAVGMPVVVESSSNGVLRRGLVIDVNSSCKTAIINLVDVGVFEDHLFDELKLLPQSLASLSPPLSVTVQLSPLLETDLVPQHGFETDAWELEWPMNAVKYFADIIKEKQSFNAHVILLPEKEEEVITIKLTYNEEETEVDVRDMLIAKLREPRPLVIHDDDSVSHHQQDNLDN